MFLVRFFLAASSLLFVPSFAWATKSGTLAKTTTSISCSPLLTVRTQTSAKSSYTDLVEKIDALISHVKMSGDGRPALQSSKDLFYEPFKELVDIFNSKKVQSKVQKDSYLQVYGEQLAVKINSVTIKTASGRFPFAASLNCLEMFRRFFSVLNSSNFKTAPVSIKNFPKTNEATYIKSLLENPKAYYDLFKERLTTQGENAKFPEFKSAVETLVRRLQKPDIIAESQKNIYLEELRLQHINVLQNILDLELPYLKTYTSIQEVIAFFDIYERGKPGSILPKLHHSIRWQYHSHRMLAENPEYILLPTEYSISLEDLIKLRGVPIGLVGIVTQPEYADGFYQSPLEFWFHDVNHSRRAWEQSKLRAQELSLTIEQYLQISHTFLNEEILPIIEIKKTDSKELTNLKRLSRVILFEIAHEEALPIDRDLLSKLLARKPFENGNFLFEKVTDAGVKYYTGPMASVLTVTFRKLEGEFYDMSSRRDVSFGDKNVRTRKMVTKAAIWLNEQLNLGVDPEILKANVQDDSGMPNDLRAKLVKKYQRDPKHTAPIIEEAAIKDYQTTGRMKKPVEFFFDRSGKHIYPR